MRGLAAVVIVALLSGPAFGQPQAPVQRYGEKDKDKTPQQLRSEKDAEEAYKRSLGNIPEQKATDPWGNVRSDSTAKPEKPAKKAKSGSGTTAN